MVARIANPKDRPFPWAWEVSTGSNDLQPCDYRTRDDPRGVTAKAIDPYCVFDEVGISWDMSSCRFSNRIIHDPVYPLTSAPSLVIADQPRFPNLYIDTSAYVPSRYPPALVEYMRGRGAKRVTC